MKQPIALLVALVLWLPYFYSSADEFATEGRSAAGYSPEGSSTKMDQTQDAVADENGVILLVTSPGRWVIGQEFNVRVLLINQSRRPVVYVQVDDWYDLNPAMVDEDGRSVPLTDYGRGKLGERTEFRRRIRSVLEPGHFHSWNVDLSKAFKPEPGLLELSLTVKYRFHDDSDRASGQNTVNIDGISIEAVSDRAIAEQDLSDTLQVDPIRAVGADMNPRERYLAAERDIDAARREYVRDLRERYGDPGERTDHLQMPTSREYAHRANRIFREWNPIGFGSDDLRKILGEPHREVEALHRHFPVLWEYDFIVGPAGAHWRFGVDPNDRIVAIEFIPGE